MKHTDEHQLWLNSDIEKSTNPSEIYQHQQFAGFIIFMKGLEEKLTLKYLRIIQTLMSSVLDESPRVSYHYLSQKVIKHRSDVSITQKQFEELVVILPCSHMDNSAVFPLMPCEKTTQACN